MDHRAPSPRRFGQEMLAVVATSVIGLVYLGVNLQIGAPSFTSGQIVGFGLVEKKVYGQAESVVRAQVKLSERQTVSVALPNGAFCRIGSFIEIEEAHTIFGSQFVVGLHGCSPRVSHDHR